MLNLELVTRSFEAWMMWDGQQKGQAIRAYLKIRVVCLLWPFGKLLAAEAKSGLLHGLEAHLSILLRTDRKSSPVSNSFNRLQWSIVEHNSMHVSKCR